MEPIFASQAADVAAKVVLLIAAFTVHEYAHAITARWAGDHTASDAGRVTLNPLKHIELLNSIVIPAVLLVMSGGRFLMGGAKPTPIDQAALSDYQSLGVTMAGPASNVIFGLLSFGALLGLAPLVTYGSLPYLLLAGLIFINALLVIFNLLPIPGLDGAELVRFVLPQPLKRWWDLAGRYGLGMLIMILLMVAIWYQYIDITPVWNLLVSIMDFVQTTFIDFRMKTL